MSDVDVKKARNLVDRTEWMVGMLRATAALRASWEQQLFRIWVAFCDAARQVDPTMRAEAHAPRWKWPHRGCGVTH